MKISEIIDGEIAVRDLTPEEEQEFLSLPNMVEPTDKERLEAQVLYTALMTDTLLEG